MRKYIDERVCLCRVGLGGFEQREQTVRRVSDLLESSAAARGAERRAGAARGLDLEEAQKLQSERLSALGKFSFQRS